MKSACKARQLADVLKAGIGDSRCQPERPQACEPFQAEEGIVTGIGWQHQPRNALCLQLGHHEVQLLGAQRLHEPPSAGRDADRPVYRRLAQVLQRTRFSREGKDIQVQIRAEGDRL